MKLYTPKYGSSLKGWSKKIPYISREKLKGFMISEKQYKLLKEYLIPNLPQGQLKTFHELARLNLINAVYENGKELYVITNKGLAEVENCEQFKKQNKYTKITIIISFFGALFALASLLVTIFKQ